MNPDITVQKTIAINTNAFRIWQTLTHPGLLKTWMSDGEIEIISEWKVGGSFVVRGRANGNYEYKGTIVELKPEKILSYTSWNKISRLPDTPENYSLITFQLEPLENERTRLTLTHSNLIAKAAFEHSNFYWGSALGVLKRMAEEDLFLSQ